jgi:hypothetical protein
MVAMNVAAGEGQDKHPFGAAADLVTMSPCY